MKCISYNLKKYHQTKPPLLVWNQMQKKYICVDNCIAETIKFLLENEINTLGSCCGHGEKPPNIVIATNEDPRKTRELISKVSEMDFIIYKWKLTIV